MLPRNKITFILLLVIVLYINPCQTLATVQSGDAYFPPSIDGLIGDREYYDAIPHTITLSSNSETLSTQLYVKNDNEYLYLAFRIEDPSMNNLMILRLADTYGNIVSKHSRYDQGDWSLYYNGSENIVGDTASFESAWGSYGEYRIVEWKIPFNTTSLNDLKANVGDPLKIGIRYGLDDGPRYPAAYDYDNPDTWDWLFLVTPERVKNGDFEDEVFLDPWEIPGWDSSGGTGVGSGEDSYQGRSLGLRSGYVSQIVWLDENSSVYFWYRPFPFDSEVELQVHLGGVTVFSESYSESYYEWSQMEIKFRDAMEKGLEPGLNELRFVVVDGSSDAERPRRPRVSFDSVTIDASSPSVLIDETFMSKEHTDVGASIEVGFHFMQMPQGVELVDSKVLINGTKYVSDSEGWVRFYATSMVVGSKHWVIDSVNGATNFEVNAEVPEVIWDSVLISVPESQRIDVGSDFIWSGRYAYNNQVFSGELVLNQPSSVKEVVGEINYTIGGIVDSQYGLSVFEAPLSFVVIYDKVELELSIEDPRIDVGETPYVSYSGNYLYDSTPFEGTLSLVDFSDNLGQEQITVASITDSKYGITEFECNSVECIWDRINIVDGGVSESSVNVDEEVEVWFRAEYAYDSDPFTGDDGKLFINGEEATWSDNKWLITVSSDTPEKVSYRVSSITDDQYGLSSFSQNVSDVEVEWKNAGIPGFPVEAILVSLSGIGIFYNRKRINNKSP